jgi:membrane fusion protein, multidrug efflux system
MTTAFVTDIPVSRPSLAIRMKALPLRALLIAGAATAAMLLGTAWIAWPASSVSTDDAYVKADSTIIAPKVHGLVAQVLVRDNQHVVAGQPLIRIDPEDYEQDVAAAQADVASADAALAQQSSQLALASANARAASADIRSADAQSARAAADRKRFDTLVANGDVSKSQAETARATAASMSADAEKSRASYAASQQQVAVIGQSRGLLLAALAKARSALSLAKQNLDHSVIRSPVTGVVGDRQVQIGEYVQPGTQLMTIVPMDTIYVLANFKETQTARMLVGQKARVTFDALPGKHFDGEVESFAPGSGSEFSLLPYEPATGNFTRIVQRVPVRIHLTPGQDGSSRLRPGLSADVDVTLKG